MLDRPPIMIIVIINLKEVAELDQGYLDQFRRVHKTLELCQSTLSDSICGLHQAQSSFSDFFSVVFMVGRERLRQFLLVITPNIA